MHTPVSWHTQVNSASAAAMAKKQPKILNTPADKVKPRLEHLARLLKVCVRTCVCGECNV
jgi:hypothetical protein